MTKMILWWFIAIFITITAAYYQRLTGPTHPKRVSVTIKDKTYKFKLPRSESGDKPCLVEIPIEDEEVEGKLFYKRYPTNEDWTEVELFRKENILVNLLPNQPPAGKLAYFVQLEIKDKKYTVSKEKPAIIRYKGEVPALVLIPHVLFMFVAMLLSTLAGILAIAKNKKHVLYGKITFITLLIGGMILGPLVQKYAFGELWTGIPFGWDLTDNKTLIAVVAWFIALIGNRKERTRPWLTVTAAAILLLIYSIPHSAMGSEFDYSTGKVTTGYMLNHFIW